MTTRIRNPNPSFESIIRNIRDILGPEISAEIETRAKLSHLSFEMQWLRIVRKGIAAH